MQIKGLFESNFCIELKITWIDQWIQLTILISWNMKRLKIDNVIPIYKINYDDNWFDLCFVQCTQSDSIVDGSLLWTKPKTLSAIDFELELKNIVLFLHTSHYTHKIPKKRNQFNLESGCISDWIMNSQTLFHCLLTNRDLIYLFNEIQSI